jgi:hypothetical protein
MNYRWRKSDQGPGRLYPDTALYAIVIASVWKTAVVAVLFMAGLQGIRHLLAAKIDGAAASAAAYHPLFPRFRLITSLIGAFQIRPGMADARTVWRVGRKRRRTNRQQRLSLPADGAPPACPDLFSVIFVITIIQLPAKRWVRTTYDPTVENVDGRYAR